MLRLSGTSTSLSFAPILVFYPFSNSAPRKSPWNPAIVTTSLFLYNLDSSVLVSLSNFFYAVILDAEMSWLTKVIANPTKFTNSIPPTPIEKTADVVPLSSTSPDDIEKDTTPPPYKRTRAGKGKSQASQNSAPPDEIIRRKYPTHRSQGLPSQPIDVDS